MIVPEGRLGPTAPLPLPVMDDNGKIMIIEIPRMAAAEFEFFKMLLDLYKSAIVKEEPRREDEKKSEAVEHVED